MEDDLHTPTARHLLPLLPIVFVIAWVIRSYELYPWVSTRSALAIAVASAALVGLPAAHWALASGRHRAAFLIPLGAAVALVPQFLILCSAVLGLLVRVGAERTTAMLERGAPIPAMGVMPWPTFARAQLSAAVIGALSGFVYWMYVRRIDRNRRTSS